MNTEQEILKQFNKGYNRFTIDYMYFDMLFFVTFWKKGTTELESGRGETIEEAFKNLEIYTENSIPSQHAISVYMAKYHKAKYKVETTKSIPQEFSISKLFKL